MQIRAVVIRMLNSKNCVYTVDNIYIWFYDQIKIHNCPLRVAAKVMKSNPNRRVQRAFRRRSRIYIDTLKIIAN